MQNISLVAVESLYVQHPSTYQSILGIPLSKTLKTLQRMNDLNDVTASSLRMFLHSSAFI